MRVPLPLSKESGCQLDVSRLLRVHVRFHLRCPVRAEAFEQPFRIRFDEQHRRVLRQSGNLVSPFAEITRRADRNSRQCLRCRTAFREDQAVPR